MSNTLKVTGVAEIETPLEIGEDYTIGARLSIVSIEKSDNQDGTYNYGHKGKLQLIGVTTKEGETYKGKVKEYDFLNYALFVTFFPHLLAGPIIHHADMMPQFASRWNMAIRYRNVAAGLFLFSIGLFKKVVIADTFATWANNGFDVATSLNLIEAWATSLSYTFQLYFDFSGYTEYGNRCEFDVKHQASCKL